MPKTSKKKAVKTSSVRCRKTKPVAIPSDLEIAQAARSKMKHIYEIAAMLGLEEDDLELYGRYKAKIHLDVLERWKDRPDGHLIDVTAITPTPLGEGKTVTAIGLGQALHRIGKRVCNTLREPSLGPQFGIKGGAAGGGYSQVMPMEDVNLHFTGDIHAVSMANNQLAAYIDASLYHGNPLKIDPPTISWRRVIDSNDGYALRNIVIGLGANLPRPRRGGVPRESGFDISVASEVMAILAMTTGLQDMRKRLGRIIVAYNVDGQPVTAEDLRAAGMMTVLLKDAIMPNLIQTLENSPCIMHAGPFANIAQGNNSILADQIALKCADYVVTESGFGADMGAEKFMNIKCRVGGLTPSCVVITLSIRALKAHSGRFNIVAGKPLDPGLRKENLQAIEEGSCNLVKHIKNMQLFGVPVVVSINRFTDDTDREVALVKEIAEAEGARCAPIEVWAHGGAGGVDLAHLVVEACEEKTNFRFLYPDNWSIKEKIEAIATQIYGAADVDYSAIAEEQIQRYTAFGLDKLPICMAKTHLSLSHDPTLKGAPTGFTLPVREIRPSAGAGFLYPLCGEMSTMPGLPSTPAGWKVDINEKGETVGLF
ncbi:MAG: formate--tetrahydrofolate ligase [Candidatus Zipacnadales bacterium]